MTVSALRSSFENSWSRIVIFIPFIWPKNFVTKIYWLLSILILLLTSAINVYTPIYGKKIVDSLTSRNDDNKLEFRWDFVFIYSLLKYLRGLDFLKDIFWDKVEHYINKEIEGYVFQHIQQLSMRWHLNRKTGEVLQIMSSTRHSLSYLLNMSLLTVIPSMIDIIFILGYFAVLFNVGFSILLSICLIGYLVYVINGRRKLYNIREEEITAAYKIKDKCIDSLLNYETVKYFGNERYEVDCFKKAVDRVNVSQFAATKQRYKLLAVENFITDFSLMLATLICVYNVVNSQRLTVGDYIMLCEYFTNIYSSVTMIAYVFNAVGSYFTEVENLYQLLIEKPEIVDSPDAKVLEITGGKIEFKNVFFQYIDNQPILKNISFSVPSGQTLAIVGPTGSGKSTIIRLIFRFYDVTSGSILIDDQNIKDVTQESLRRAVGVVPQDTVLFNDTIRYNIAYGDMHANENEIEEAAKAADIHNSILNFVNGFETEVGERGLRLSGGEKQRVAIARTILKDPRIVLLDESTSALDTQTERNIQASFRRICSKRTTIIIAHRLSTIIHADQILVLKEGIIVERGRHEQLIEKNGLYASMWKQQLEAHNT